MTENKRSLPFSMIACVMAHELRHAASSSSPTTVSPLARVATRTAVPHSEPAPIAAVKRRLLLAAIEKFPRLRNDLDIIVISQYLLSLESFSSVSPQALHYLATECTSLSLRDGDVFCYQEDKIATDSTALVIVEGSLCGYINKPFSQRSDQSECFPHWNARQNRHRGVLVDFGDIQTTYSSAALCGFDDLLITSHTTTSDETPAWSRRKGIHAQEQTRAIAFKKDTLDRAVHRFGLTYERQTLQSKRESASTDVSHLAILTPFSESGKQALYNATPRRVMPCGDVVFTSPGDTSTITAFLLVLSGRIDIFWTGAQITADSTTSSTTTATPASVQLEFKSTPIYSIRRGQHIGEQTIGLALDDLFASTQEPAIGKLSATDQVPANRLPIRIVSGDDATEVMVLTRSLFYEKRTEDHEVLSYYAQMSRQRALVRQPVASALELSSVRPPSTLLQWAVPFFTDKAPVERTISDLHELLWRLTTDSVARRAFFQLPPLVLERIAHAMELLHCASPTPSLLVDEGAEADEVYVVVHGALRIGGPDQVDPRRVYLPGDIYGLVNSESPLHADAGTMLLTIPRHCIERWLTPVLPTIVVNAGSLFARHSAYTTAHSHRFSTPTNEKHKSLTVMARRNSGQSASTSELPIADQAIAHTEALARVLQRMGYMSSLPQFLLRELLADAAIVSHPAGHVVFHENESTSALVVLLSGFLRVFSLENMGSTVDMFRNHPFCEFSSLHQLLTTQQSRFNDVDTPSVPTPMRRRSAMYGVHIQTLHAHNAFRTGVLSGNTKCPATVVAQSPCELLVIDEGVYSRVLKKHTAPIDVSRYELLGRPPTTHENATEDRNTVVGDGKYRLVGKVTPSALTKIMEVSTGPTTWWSGLSLIKKQCLLRQSRLVTLQPGERFLRCGDLVDHVFIVVRGGLALYVHQHHEGVAQALDASQRSVRSLMLERNVTSNYSTTSHQLNCISSNSTADSRRLQHKRSMLKHKVNRMVTTTNAAEEPSGDDTVSTLFVHSVLAAVGEEKRKCVTSPKEATDAATSSAVQATQQSGQRSPATRSAHALTFHSAVTRAPLQHRHDVRRGPSPQRKAVRIASDNDTATLPNSSTVLCYLAPGDVYGEEALTQLLYRSPHNILADTSACTLAAASLSPTSFASSSMNVLAAAASTPPPTSVELVCIHRKTFLDIQTKSDDELEQELRGRSKAVKSKWQAAEQSVLQARKASTGGSLSSTTTPKLFDLFKNILNQRYYITMRAIADIPVLCDLPDAVKQEICIGARFEAVERFTNVFNDNGVAKIDPAVGATSHRFYFVLNGRVGLFPKSATHSASLTSDSIGAYHASSSRSSMLSLSSSSSSGGTGHHHHGQLASVAANMEQCLQDVRAGRGFGELEVLLPEASRYHILAVALEATTLLSLPAELFVRCWPQVAAMQRNVEYLRHGVQFFQRLEMEKISYLYYGLQNESYSRNAKILVHQQPLHKNELVFLQEGECSVKTKVAVHAHGEEDTDSNVNANAEDRSTKGKDHTRQQPPHHAMQVLATIADVRGGHVFWLDGQHAPFTLQAISARVSIARITVDKLKLILPKSHMQILEQHCEALAALHREQLQRARHTIVRLMNDKRQAELGRPTDSIAVPFLPSLHFSMQNSSKKAQLQARAGISTKPLRKLGATSTEPAPPSPQPVRLEPPAIPYARVLSSKPVDLAEIYSEDKTQKQQTEAQYEPESTDDTHEERTALRSVAESNWQTDLDKTYRQDHAQEHYEVADGSASLSSVALLRGSFPDDPSLRRRNSRLMLSVAQSSSLSVRITPSISAKEDEMTQAETVTTSPRVQLRVTLPVPQKPIGSADTRRPSRPTTPVADAKLNSASSTKKQTFTVDYYGNASNDLEDLDDRVDFVMDLRVMLRNEMQSPFSPLRSISLAPSECKIHSLGKFIDPPVLSPLRQTQAPPDIGGAGLKDVKPRGWQAKASRPFRITSKPSPRSVTTDQQAIVHKHGFLSVVAVPVEYRAPGYLHDDFLRRVVHRQRRHLFVLQDGMLHEYPEDTVLTELSNQRPTHSFEVTAVEVSECPSVVGGEAEVVLRHSFLLTVSPPPPPHHSSQSFLMTTEALVEKRLWMEAIIAARAMGKPPVLVTTANPAENGTPGSPRFKHRESMALSTTVREHRRLFQHSGAGRNAIVQADQVLEVEYRIS